MQTTVAEPDVVDGAAYAEGAADDPAVRVREALSLLRRTAEQVSTDTGADEAEPVPAWLPASHADADARRELDRQRIGMRYDRRLSDLAARQAEAAQTTTDRDDHAKQALTAEHDAARADLEARAAEQKGDLQKAYRHERWLADSVLEGVTQKEAQRRAEANAQADGWLGELHRLLDRGDARLKRYRLDDTTLFRPAPDAAPPPAEVQEVEPPPLEQIRDGVEQAHAAMEDRTDDLERLFLSSLFIGTRPYLLLLLAAGVSVAAGFLAAEGLRPTLAQNSVPHALGALLIGGLLTLLCLGAGWLLAKRARRQAIAAAEAADAASRHYHHWLDQYRLGAAGHEARRVRRAAETRKQSHAETARKFDPPLKALKTKLAAVQAQAEAQRAAALAMLEREQGEAAAARTASDQQATARLTSRRDRRLALIVQRHERDAAELNRRGHASLQARRAAWAAARERAEPVLRAAADAADADAPAWSDAAWIGWKPEPADDRRPAPVARLRVEPAALVPADVHDAGDQSNLAAPLLLSPGITRSLTVTCDANRRADAIDLVRSTMLRLLTLTPPGRLRFTLIDPVALGESFAAFMHLADHDELLVDGRIWSEPHEVNRRLGDLTDHMAQVIQKYLRNDFADIDAYNRTAGELAEPYRCLVLADLPHRLPDEALNRLQSIVTSGPRCGVFVLLLRDSQQALPDDLEDALHRHTRVVRVEADGARAADGPENGFPLTLPDAPAEATVTALTGAVGAAAAAGSRVVVPFAAIAPDDAEAFTRTTDDRIAVPIGRTGATAQQAITLGVGVAQHALIAGKTGSGKSSLLHTLITNACLWHGPDEVELYLVDFKKGVEFKPYADHPPPHLRAVAIESDREFGLSILERLDRQMDDRGQRFRDAGVAGLAAWREKRPDDPMPRTLLVIDEFQELFSRDDALSQNAAMLLDRLVRQGRAFGMHAVLGSQSLSGAAGLSRSTLGQMAVRIALQCNENDAQLILGDDNTAARLLSRPGEAIYNDRGGDPEGNSLFQVAFLPDEALRERLRQVEADAPVRQTDAAAAVVFEGSAPAAFDLEAVRAAPPAADLPAARVGEPIAIAPPVALRFPRVAGAHALVLGQNTDAALGVVRAAVLSLDAAHAAAGMPAHLTLLNGSPEPAHREVIEATARLLQSPADLPSYSAAEQTIETLYREMQARRGEPIDEAAPAADPGAGDVPADPDDWDALLETPAAGRETPRAAVEPKSSETTHYAVIIGLERMRFLQRADDGFGFGGGGGADADTLPAPPVQLETLLAEGPAFGIHLVLTCDRVASLERIIDRRAMRDIDQRVLFQMSANDSAQLIDAPDANDLGPHRALLHREDQGTLTRFRPYALR